MLKKILPWVIFATMLLLLIIGFSMKDWMNEYISNVIKNQASIENITSGQDLINSRYNYVENGLAYEITFLEFGAIGCVACKRMETVMDEIRTMYPVEVNVIFMNILIPENQNLMKYYGVSSIPTQVLLDKSGNEYFRHTGYYPTAELSKHFKRLINDK